MPFDVRVRTKRENAQLQVRYAWPTQRANQTASLLCVFCTLSGLLPIKRTDPSTNIRLGTGVCRSGDWIGGVLLDTGPFPHARDAATGFDGQIPASIGSSSKSKGRYGGRASRI